MKGLLRQIDKYKFNSSISSLSIYYYHFDILPLKFSILLPTKCHPLLSFSIKLGNHLFYPTQWVWPIGRVRSHVRISRRPNILNIEATGGFVRSLISKISQSTRKLVRTDIRLKKKNPSLPFRPSYSIQVFTLFNFPTPPSLTQTHANSALLSLSPLSPLQVFIKSHS